MNTYMDWFGLFCIVAGAYITWRIFLGMVRQLAKAIRG